MASAEVRVVFDRSSQAIAAIDGALDKALLAVAQAIADDAQIEIQSGPKTGRVYGTHQASAPGEVPAMLTGALFEGIKARMDSSEGEHVAVVVSEDEKSAWLEYGTPGGKIAARPFLGPAAARIAPEADRIAADEMRKATR